MENELQRKKKFSTKNMVMVAVFGAVGAVLMVVLEFPLPFAPSFLEMDFSNLAVILSTFILGPIAGTATALIKILLKLVFKGTTTMFVGEIADFIVTLAYLWSCALVYRFKKGKSGAVLSLACGTVFVSIVSIFVNLFLNFPFYSTLYGIPLDAIVGMGTAINSHITNLFTLMIFSVLPFNLVKYGALSILTFFTYKRLKNILIKQ